MSLKIYLANDLQGRHIIHYTLQLIAFNKSAEFTYIDSPAQADFRITDSSDSDIPHCAQFYQYLTDADFAGLKTLVKGSFHFYSSEGKEDHLAAIFYLVNSLQEYETKAFDKYGRFPFLESLQHKEGILHRNVVQQLMDDFLASHPALAKIKATPRRSGFFLTHDIDTIYGAKNQNGDYALKHHQYHRIPGLLWNHYIGKPDWLNMDRIMSMEEQHGFKSTFYWLVHKDKMNADYDLEHPDILHQASIINRKGFEIGLHKSLRETDFDDELGLIGTIIKDRTVGQRYHFLKFNLPQAWIDIENANLKLDTSLGYSEGFGFRNSYGLPFMPYNVKEKRVYDFIEVPMNIMDGNFFYQGKTVAQAEKELVNWLDTNKENTVITINFHNNFFDDMLYAGYDKLYETILRYFKEEKLTCMTQASLIHEFYQPQLFA
ncbi:MAG: hypothetical protein JWO03_2679 [Bacteroidetes bacterium]|nr:hypothetical protein [Bacteroidota bacterium]